MTPKKLTRKELLKTPDEFLTLSDRTFHFIREHSKQFINIGFIVLAVVVLGFAINWYLNSQTARALAAYNQAAMEIPPESEYDAGEVQQAISALEGVVKEWNAKQPTQYALLDLGRLYYRAGEYDKSLDAYQKFLATISKSDDPLRYYVLDSIAYAYEAKGELDKAVESWNKIVALPGKLLKEEAYLGLGRIYQALNKKSEAAKAYQSYLTEYPNSPRAVLAKAKQAELSN